MKKLLALLLTSGLALGALTGCAGKTASSETSSVPEASSQVSSAASEQPSSAPAEKTAVSLAGLKGPTGFGMVKLMSDSESKSTANDYTVTIAGAADEITAKLIKGELDIAAVPTNLAAVLYQKSNGGVQILNVNTLGVLYMLTKNEEITDWSQLKGKTIYSTGKGAMPEYVLNFLLEKNGLDPEKDVTVEYLSEHSELASKMIASTEPMIAVLPQPFVTQVTMKDDTIKKALDLTEEWNKATNNESVLSMGCIVVNKAFADAHPDAVDAFRTEYKASVEYTNEHPADAAQLIEKYGMLANAKMAETAIPACHITYMDGAEMKSKLTGLFEVLYAANPASVGGALPDDAFYYSK